MAEFVDNSVRVRREIQERLAKGLNEANNFHIDSARGDAPVGKTGNLRDGIEVLQEASESSLMASGAAKAVYSAAINRGTSATEAQPFWTASWIRMRAKFRDFF